MKTKLIRLEPDAREVIRKDAEKAFPEECCGFVYGKEEEDQRIINQAIPVVNSKAGDKKRRFEIAPADYLKAERFADENGLSLLGVYHSHPQHPAYPSEHDRAQALPWFSYLIISVIDGKSSELNSFQLDPEHQFVEEQLFQEHHIP